MYCDGCGNQLTLGGQYCTKCGKAILPGGTATFSATGQGFGSTYGGSTGAYRGQTGTTAGAPGRAAGASDGRVRRNIQRLATLWMINGILRLTGIAWMMIFGRMFFPFMRGAFVWPFGGRWGWDIPFLPLGIFLGFFGVLHLVLAWGLFEREPWARFLGLVLGFLALVRFPLGTALGIYTLWVLMPEPSGREYERLTQGGGHMNSATASS